MSLSAVTPDSIAPSVPDSDTKHRPTTAKLPGLIVVAYRSGCLTHLPTSTPGRPRGMGPWRAPLTLLHLCVARYHSRRSLLQMRRRLCVPLHATEPHVRTVARAPAPTAALAVSTRAVAAAADLGGLKGPAPGLQLLSIPCPHPPSQGWRHWQPSWRRPGGYLEARSCRGPSKSYGMLDHLSRHTAPWPRRSARFPRS